MGGRTVTPEEGVANGAEWQIKGRSLVDALFGSTEMGLIGIPKDHINESLVRDVLLRPFRELAESQADLHCKYVESYEPQQTRFAEFSLRHEDRYRLDITDQLNECLRAQGASWAAYHLIASDFLLDWKVDGSGTLLWNVTEGHYESLEFEARVEVEAGLEIEAQGQTHKIKFSAEGTCKWTMRAKQRD